MSLSMSASSRRRRSRRAPRRLGPGTRAQRTDDAGDRPETPQNHCLRRVERRLDILHPRPDRVVHGPRAGRACPADRRSGHALSGASGRKWSRSSSSTASATRGRRRARPTRPHVIVTTSCARLLTAIIASQKIADVSSTLVAAVIVGPSGVPFQKNGKRFEGQMSCQPHVGRTGPAKLVARRAAQHG